MDPRHGKMRMNVQGDRLSSLPDDLFHKIFSFINIKDAIETSELSSRWRFLWTTMPYLNFSSEDFSTLPEFSKFVTNVLYSRKPLTYLYSLNLTFRVKASQLFLKRVLSYAFLHNIQQLNVVWLLENDIELPLYLFDSKSLKHLSFTMKLNRTRIKHCFTSTWALPALTTLDLHSVILRDDNADTCISVFSNCKNLKNLTLKEFKTTGSNGFSLCHPRLTNLTLENNYHMKVVNVAAPQLKSLTIKFCSGEHVISAPDLASLFYKGYNSLQLSTEGFHSLEKAKICVLSPQKANTRGILCLLQQLHSVKLLTLNMEIVEILSISADLILQQPSPFVNLKSLYIYPERLSLENQAPKKVTIMSNELKSYLLDSSSGSIFTVVLREELIAQKIMAELRVILDKVNDNTKTNRAHLERVKTQVESHKPKLKIGENMMQIKSCWKNLVVQIGKASVITSKLQEIEELLTKLPVSKRAKIQPGFSSLCADANIAISKITDCVKVQCDENQSLSSVCFQELATTLEPST